MSLDGVVLLEKPIDELGPYIMGGQVQQSPKMGNVIIDLTLPLWGGDVEFDFDAPFHVVDVAVGEHLSSRAEFRLELSRVGPFGCLRSAAVPPSGSDEEDWYLAAEEAAYGRDEARIFSQNGEDGVLSALLEELGYTSVVRQVCHKLGLGPGGCALPERSDSDISDVGRGGSSRLNKKGLYLEIGAGDGAECNTRLLREAGWKDITLDSGHENPEINLYQAFVTPDTVNDALSPAAQRASLSLDELDVLSIDIDGMDWYIWASIGGRVRPKLVIIEYNSMLAAPADAVQPPNGCNGFDAAALASSMWFGAGAGAVQALGVRLGYTLVYAETRGVNLFMVRNDLVGLLRPSSHLGNVSKTLALVRWRPCYAPKPYKSHISWDKAKAMGMQWMTASEAVAACLSSPRSTYPVKPPRGEWYTALAFALTGNEIERVGLRQ